MSTTEARFQAAVAAVQAQGVPFTLNVMTCCQGCATPQHVGLTDETEKTTPYAWTFGGQGQELVWSEYGNPSYRDEAQDVSLDDPDGSYYVPDTHRCERPADDLYINHGGPDLKAAQVVTEAFKGQGFRVDWDGSEFDSVVVHFA